MARKTSQTLSVSNLVLSGCHGVFESEKRFEQKFSFSINIKGEFSKSSVSDDLKDTVDYGLIIELIKKGFNQKTYNLIEAMGAELSQLIYNYIVGLSIYISSFSLKVTKLSLPINEDARSSFSLTRKISRDAYLSIGSNLGDRRKFLELAVSHLNNIKAMSSVYETEPVGVPSEQPDYLNMVVKIQTAKSPLALLKQVQKIEKLAGRVRTERFGPRTLDIDILRLGNLVSDDERVLLPHPRMKERAFVLIPLAEISPELVPVSLQQRAIGNVRYFCKF